MAKKTGKFQQKEADQIDAFYNEMNDVPTKKKRAGLIVIITLVAILAIIGGTFGALVYFNDGGPVIITNNTTLESGITIAGISVGGMTKEEAIAAVNDAIGNSYSSQPMVITVLDQNIEISPSESGVNPDVETAVHDAFYCGTESNPQLQLSIAPYLSLNEEAIRGKIQQLSQSFPTEGTQSTWEVKQSGEDDTEVLTLTIGTNYYDFDTEALYNLIIEAYSTQQFAVNYDINQLNTSSIDLDAIYAEKCVEMVNAELVPDTLEVTQSVEGYIFDLESAKEALSVAQPGETLEFPFEKVEPEMSTELLESMLFRDVLGTCEAYQSSGSNRATNLRLACEAIDGLILMPGDTFSYNGTLGERTPEKGYKPAASYSGGKTVQSYGGGICQPSSALYYACLHADLEIVQRDCHSYPSSYVPLGMDATVDWNGPDYKFRNNTDYPIRIEAKADGGQVNISLIGTDTKDYYVKMEYEVWGVSYPKEVIKEVKPGSGHYDGEVETTPYTGYTVQTFKLKYDKETGELISREKEAYSVYSKRDKVVYKVIEEEEEEEEKPTEPKPTEPKPTEPKPTEPKPTEPKPTEPAPTEPAPTEPAPTEPAPTEPAPTEPAPTEPAPTEAAPDNGGE